MTVRLRRPKRTAIRMLPVMLSTLGTGLDRRSVAFIAWFGPRGLASIILALVVVDEVPELPSLATMLAAVTVTVLASIVAHGVSAGPLVRAYGRHAGRLEAGAAEHAAVPEMPTRGRMSGPI